MIVLANVSQNLNVMTNELELNQNGTFLSRSDLFAIAPQSDFVRYATTFQYFHFDL